MLELCLTEPDSTGDPECNCFPSLKIRKKKMQLSYLSFLFSRNLWSEFLLAIGRSVTEQKPKTLVSPTKFCETSSIFLQFVKQKF